MKHTYHIHGMTCNGCCKHVEEMVLKVKGVLYPIFGLFFSPMIAALAMSFSSVSVSANALRSTY